jgi:hypothetical protein
MIRVGRSVLIVFLLPVACPAMARAERASDAFSEARQALLPVEIELESPTPLSPAQRTTDEEIMQQAKLAMFDKDWSQALRKLRDLQSRFPTSSLATPAIFYEATTLENLNRKEESLQKYEAFLGRTGGEAPLREQAHYSIIGLSADLYNEGKTSYIDRAIKALKDGRKSVRYYAALRLSYIKDRKINDQAVPTLKDILRQENDPELRDRASLAILRIDPKLLDQERGRWLTVVVMEDGKEVSKLTLPLSLAMLVIKALPDEARREIEARGIRPENILDDLKKLAPGEIFEFKTKNGAIRIQIK